MKIGQLIFHLPAEKKQKIRRIAKINKKIASGKSSLVFTRTCIKENLLPEYTNIYIFLYFDPTFQMFIHLFSRINLESNFKIHRVIARPTTPFYPQINQTQVQINQTQVQINQTQVQINQSHVQINQSQFQINQTQFQINQSQFQINQSQFQINQSQFQINRTQFQINQTQFQTKKKHFSIFKNI